MNDDTKNRDRWLAGMLISRLLNKTGTSAKLAVVAGGIGIPAVIAAGLYFDIDLDLDSEPLPDPPPIIEPLNETSTPALIDAGASDAPGSHKPGLEGSTPSPATTPALIEEPEEPNKITIGQSQPSAPSSTTEEPEWTPTPTPRAPRESTSQPSPSKNETSTTEVITPASSPVPASFSTPEPFPTAIPEPTEETTPTATTTTSPVPTSTPALSDGDKITPEPSPTATPYPTVLSSTSTALVTLTTDTPKPTSPTPSTVMAPVATPEPPEVKEPVPETTPLFPRKLSGRVAEQMRGKGFTVTDGWPIANPGDSGTFTTGDETWKYGETGKLALVWEHVSWDEQRKVMYEAIIDQPLVRSGDGSPAPVMFEHHQAWIDFLSDYRQAKIDAVTEGVLTFASHRVAWFEDGVLVYQTTIGALLQQSLSHIAGR